jgi:hypothetical protein
MQAIVRREPAWDPILEWELYWFRLYLTRSANPRSEPDGSFFIGDCEDAADLKIDRWSPYTIARRSTAEREP